jgi:RNA polymerase sigma-70 factor (ECF subfamily)
MRCALSADVVRPQPEATAFRRLYDEHGAFAWRALRTFGVPPWALEDAVQDVFVVVFRRLGEYDAARSFRGWLWGIARNVAATYLRTQHRAVRREAAVIAGDREAAQGPDGALAARQALALVERFLAALPEGLRDAFVLSDIEGWSPTEVAQALGVPVGTVYSRLHTARGRFAEVARAVSGQGAGP